MKNSKLFPFERNNYFYGKLLTVRDFETEQKYFNDKRRMINKFVLGSGIVSGLQVVAVDDKTIYIEPGIALDGMGREIIISSPVTQKLSLIEGFSNIRDQKNLYLCVAYDEKGKEPVHSLSNEGENGIEASQYNRVFENYRIFIKEEEHNENFRNSNSLTEEVTLLFDDNKVKVWKITPKFVAKDSKFIITFKIEKIVPTLNIELEQELILENLYTEDGGDTLQIRFFEGEHPAANEYEIQYVVKSGSNTELAACISAKNEGFHFKIGDKAIPTFIENKSKIKVVAGTIKKEIINSYFSQSLEEGMGGDSEHCIHLAKISIVQAGAAFMIEKIIENPLEEQVYNNGLLKKLTSTEEDKEDIGFSTKVATEVMEEGINPKVEIEYDGKNKEFDFKFKFPKPQILSKNSSTGRIEVSIERKLLQNKGYFTDLIEHGLGKGPVSIVLGLEQYDEGLYAEIDDFNESIFYGEPRVFQNTPYEYSSPYVDTGAVVYPKKETFRIGIRCGNGTSKQVNLKIRWWAFKEEK